MAALRHAARRVCERVLPRSHRVSTARLPMSTSSSIKGGKPEPTLEEVGKQLEKRKQECEGFFLEMQRKQPGLTIVATNTDFRKSRARDYGTTARISGFGALSFFLGSMFYKQQ